jgi:hypothetical protein
VDSSAKRSYSIESKGAFTLTPGGYSGEIDHHSALKPITIPEESDQASERSDAGFSIFPEGDRFRQV